jgi:hypothetical protein
MRMEEKDVLSVAKRLIAHIGDDFAAEQAAIERAGRLARDGATEAADHWGRIADAVARLRRRPPGPDTQPHLRTSASGFA